MVNGSLVGDMTRDADGSTCSLVEDAEAGSFCGDGVGGRGVSKSEKGRW